MSTHRQVPLVEATVGFAADERGMGVAYVSTRRPSTSRRSAPDDNGSLLLRLPFRVQRFPALHEREIGYAALTVAAQALRERGVRRVAFEVADADLVADVNQRRQVPPPITLPYVRLGCELNRFVEYHLTAQHSGDDLSARARAEVALSVAA